jgi:hypothetical protein
VHRSLREQGEQRRPNIAATRPPGPGAAASRPPAAAERAAEVTAGIRTARPVPALSRPSTSPGRLRPWLVLVAVLVFVFVLLWVSH